MNADGNGVILFRDRDYQEKQFVNRTAEQQLVKEKIEEAELGNPIRGSVINLWGEGGIGKTWFLQHLRHIYQFLFSSLSSDTAVFSTFTLYEEFAPDSAMDASIKVVQSFAQQALDQLSGALTGEMKTLLRQAVDGIDASSAFVRAIQLISGQTNPNTGRKFIPILLFDDAHHISTELLAGLEKQLIEPLVTTDRVLVILAGRNRIPRWNEFEVRRRFVPVEQTRIQPFKVEDIRLQLAQLGIEHVPAEAMYAYSAGNPQLVAEFAEKPDLWPKSSSSRPCSFEEWSDPHRDEMLRLLEAFEAYLLSEIDIELKQKLYTIFPLRFYRIGSLRSMLNKSAIPVDQGKPEIHYLKILRQLDETNVVWWDHQHRAYITSPVVRQLMDRKFLLRGKLVKDERFVTGHCNALEMYQALAEASPYVSEEYLIEQIFHQASLYAASGDLTKLQVAISEIARFADEKLNADRLLILQNQFKADHEIANLLPDAQWTWFERELARLLNEKVSPK